MPQNQKTAPATAAEELPVLSVQEERLVEALVNGADNCEAYRAGYGAEGYSAAALRVRACRKVADPKIQAHLRSLRAIGFANVGLTLAARIEAEAAFAQRAEDAGNYGAAGGAYDRINKLAGLYVEQVRVVNDRVDPVQKLKQIAERSPDLAAFLAAKHGIELPEAGATKH